ncbi:MAG: hypothetical protein KIH01_06445 [Candidatus Freyarchaeota archaeon]|nr:hypothetical protein [Candidatus Jordarchaeia archaeon]
MAESLGTSVLVSGHTHRPNITLVEDVLLPTRGMRQAHGGGSSMEPPSFMTLNVSEKEVKVIVCIGKES